jgi:hypothetical protein
LKNPKKRKFGSGQSVIDLEGCSTATKLNQSLARADVWQLRRYRWQYCRLILHTRGL